MKLSKPQYNNFQFAVRLLAFDRKHWNNDVEADIDNAATKDDALNILLTETHAHLRGIVACLKEDNLRSAGTLLRPILEATANASWIIDDKSNERNRAGRYIDSIKNFNEHLESLQKNGKLDGIRIPKTVLSWSESEAEHRINKFSPQAGLVWDYCSIFTHASGSYLGLHHNTDKLAAYILVQANSYAVTIRRMVAEDSKLFEKTEIVALDRMVNEMINIIGRADVYAEAAKILKES